MTKVKDYTPKICERYEIKEFIEKYHYSKSINGVKASYCFKLLHPQTNELVGAMLYGRLAMANTWKKYVSKSEDVIELRRLVMIDDTPKNTESFFIGWSLRWLIKNTNHKVVISYADPNYNHTGIIYKASNFKLVGMTCKGKVIMYGDKKYHDKTIRTKYNGKLKPYAKKIKDALDIGEAHYIEQKRKYIYQYNLR